MPRNRGAPVGSTPMRTELTASGAGRLRDDESCVRSAGPWVYKAAIRAAKTEIPA